MTTFSSVRRQLTGRTYSAGSTAPAVATKLVRRSSTLQNAEATRRPAVAFFWGRKGGPNHTGQIHKMSLDVIDRHSEALFEFLWCPVCGHEVFNHIPFEGVFCKHCNTQVELKNRKRTVATRKLSSPASIPTRPGISTSTKTSTRPA